MAVTRELVEHTPVGAAEKWVRQTARETGWPRKLAWLLATLALGAAAILVAAVIARNDPVVGKLFEAPEDDEPVSAEELADVADARRAIQAGQGISLKDYLAGHDEA